MILSEDQIGQLPRVSVVMASYNKAAYISESIKSVLDQTYENFELIIVDDASTDSSVNIIKEFADRRIKLEGLTVNKGANYCRNIGINKATGDYLMFLDADDLLNRACLQRRVKQALNHQEFQLLVFSMGVFHRKVGDDKRRWDPVSKNPLRDFLAHKLPWSILQPFWKREFLLDLNGFDESMSRLQDVDLNTRALFRKDLKLVQLPGEVDCYYRIDESRKIFSAVDMLSRYIDSGVTYFTKFKLPAQITFDKGMPLAGTIYQLQQMIFQQRRSGAISVLEELQLLEKLLCPQVFTDLGPFRITMMKVARLLSRLPFRVPGVNWMFRKLIIL